MIALENEHLNLVKILIEAGAYVNQSDKVGVCACIMYCLGSFCAILYLQNLQPSTTITQDCLCL